MNTAAKKSPAISTFVNDEIYIGRSLLFLFCFIIFSFDYKLTLSRLLKHMAMRIEERMVLV
jgi:hypothetical protein